MGEDEKTTATPASDEESFSQDDAVDSIDAQRIREELPRSDRSPVVWKPEDATRFFMAAIQEAQKPLVQALRRPNVPLSAMLVMLLVAGASAFGIYQVYRQQMNQVRERNKELRAASDRMHAENNNANRQAAFAEAKLAATENNVQRYQDLVRVLEKENRTLEDALGSARRQLEKEQNKVNMEVERLKNGIADSYAEQNRLRKSLKIAQVRLNGQEEQNRALEKQLRAAKDLLTALQESLDAEVYESAQTRRQEGNPDPAAPRPAPRGTGKQMPPAAETPREDARPPLSRPDGETATAPQANAVPPEEDDEAPPASMPETSPSLSPSENAPAPSDDSPAENAPGEPAPETPEKGEQGTETNEAQV